VHRTCDVLQATADADGGDTGAYVALSLAVKS